MPLDSYSNLQASVLDWLARPGDPLVAPAVIDMITMFEEEARDRLKTRFSETEITVTPAPNTNIIPLPGDFVAMRELYATTSSGNEHFQYQAPTNLDANFRFSPGGKWTFTIEGLNMRVGATTWPPDPSAPGSTDPAPLTMVYMQGLPGLSTLIPTNWLLTQYPSLYLWGALTFASLYIGDDDRAGGWIQAREAGFERIKQADLAAKYPQGLMIQTDVRNP